MRSVADNQGTTLKAFQPAGPRDGLQAAANDPFGNGKMGHHAGFKRNDATGGIDRLMTSFEGTAKVQVFRPRPRHVE